MRFPDSFIKSMHSLIFLTERKSTRLGPKTNVYKTTTGMELCNIGCKIEHTSNMPLLVAT